MKPTRPPGKPDGNSLDDLITEAMDRGDFDNLPKRGMKLPLDEYFSVHPDHQASTQLLLDNKAIPQPLQDRKEAEGAAGVAEEYLRSASRKLEAMRAKVAVLSRDAFSSFPDVASAMEVSGIQEWPDAFHAPDGDFSASRQDVIWATGKLRLLILQRNHLLLDVMMKYGDLLRQAQERIAKVNARAMVGPLVGGATTQLSLIPIEDLLERAGNSLPRIQPMTEDMESRITDYARRKERGFWGRLFRKIVRN